MDTKIEVVTHKNQDGVLGKNPSEHCDLISDFEVVELQPTVTIGSLGHVSHGKSTVVKILTGVQTAKHQQEQERNITIKLGYANCKIHKCTNKECAPPGCYRATGSNQSKKGEQILCCKCSSPMQLVRHVSFVDCPGHDLLMATMINGTAVMDGAILVIAADKDCPQPQTLEHLAAATMRGINNFVVIQNKLDLVTKSEATENYTQIAAFLKDHGVGNAPIVPVCAQKGFNMDAVCQLLVERIPLPVKDLTAKPNMLIIRSFDINRPGTPIRQLQGGVAGGSLLCGVLRVGDLIEIRPGIVRIVDGVTSCTSIISKVVSLYSENNPLQFAVPGGLISVGTTVDPVLTKDDRLVGQVIGLVDHLPPVSTRLLVEFHLMTRVVGVNPTEEGTTPIKVTRLTNKETIKINASGSSIEAKVRLVPDYKNRVILNLSSPVCIATGSKISLSRPFHTHWRLIGWATVIKTKVMKVNQMTH